jgi:type VI protein secretion system component VasA
MQDQIIKQILEKQAEINELVDQLKEVSPHLFPKKKQSKRFEIPSIREIKGHVEEMGYFVDAEHFHAFYSSKDWHVGKNKMKNWKAALVTWNKNNQQAVKRTANNNDFFDSLNSQEF